jgi:predicted pyridoxine 5'-phosphate oxidase superfamily flavin-nucleotide-binding protein
MAAGYLDLTLTESVCRAQKRYYGRAARNEGAPERDPLGQSEIEFIAARDSFYLGTVSETGWPYIQHRGGSPGFLRVMNETTLAFADNRGNRQLLTTGNVSVNDRVALFLMDYKNRERLKILGHARIEDARTDPELVAHFVDANLRSAVERLVFIDVVSFDWNCPKYITTRYSIEEIEELAGPLRRRITELEVALRAEKGLGGHEGGTQFAIGAFDGHIAVVQYAEPTKHVNIKEAGL